MEQNSLVQPVDPSVEVAVKLADKFINILDVRMIYQEDAPVGYLIAFEYKFKTPTRDGWHKFVVECWTSSLNLAYMQVYDLVGKVLERMAE